MRPFFPVLGMIGCLSLAGGCVVAMGNKGTATTTAVRKQAVVLNGQIYIVDVCKGQVSMIDPECVANAKPFTGSVEKETEVTIIQD